MVNRTRPDRFLHVHYVGKLNQLACGGSYVDVGKVLGREAVANVGSYWTIDALLIDERSAEAAIEWTHFKTNQDRVLRGAEWVVFDRDSALIEEIRAYYASPQAMDLERLELAGFDYLRRGYKLVSPRETSK